MRLWRRRALAAAEIERVQRWVDGEVGTAAHEAVEAMAALPESRPVRGYEIDPRTVEIDEAVEDPEPPLWRVAFEPSLGKELNPDYVAWSNRRMNRYLAKQDQINEDEEMGQMKQVELRDLRDGDKVRIEYDKPTATGATALEGIWDSEQHRIANLRDRAGKGSTYYRISRAPVEVDAEALDRLRQTWDRDKFTPWETVGISLHKAVRDFLKGVDQ